MEYLWDIFTNTGYEDVYLGNAIISGATIGTHNYNVKMDNAVYGYLHNGDGEWITEYDFLLVDALQAEEWDIVTLQQGSKDSGLPETYADLAELAAFVKENVPEDCQLY